MNDNNYTNNETNHTEEVFSDAPVAEEIKAPVVKKKKATKTFSQLLSAFIDYKLKPAGLSISADKKKKLIRKYQKDFISELQNSVTTESIIAFAIGQKEN